MTIVQTVEFAQWLKHLRDLAGRRAITARLARLAASSHFGDVKRFDGIGEMRIFVGPGYRLYFTERAGKIVILLCGGDKASQQRDIVRAKALAVAVLRNEERT